jgi:hypothetical protein
VLLSNDNSELVLPGPPKNPEKVPEYRHPLVSGPRVLVFLAPELLSGKKARGDVLERRPHIPECLLVDRGEVGGILLPVGLVNEIPVAVVDGIG